MQENPQGWVRKLLKLAKKSWTWSESYKGLVQKHFPNPIAFPIATICLSVAAWAAFKFALAGVVMVVEGVVSAALLSAIAYSLWVCYRQLQDEKKHKEAEAAEARRIADEKAEREANESMGHTGGTYDGSTAGGNNNSYGGTHPYSQR
ncbi:hypothetical protein MK805_00660 [Shimazuella sp. AN120528]|uniref:hypothetical protein n=1 Tax=Shimazuella soli TaxID=1892854 RepID=UPI001F0CF786|nr:hypothetical protein [Shimazuella soli]MCH5583483.1 hypothetical protein [Shimazuella soli]